MALPPSRRISAPTSDAALWGVAMTPFVTKRLSRGYELDRPRLDFEQGRQESNGLAVEVETDLLRRGDGDPLPVQQLDFRVAVVEVLTGQEIVDSSHGFDLAGILDQNHIEHTVGR